MRDLLLPLGLYLVSMCMPVHIHALLGFLRFCFFVLAAKVDPPKRREEERRLCLLMCILSYVTP